MGEYIKISRFGGYPEFPGGQKHCSLHLCRIYAYIHIYTHIDIYSMDILEVIRIHTERLKYKLLQTSIDCIKRNLSYKNEEES